MGPNAIGWGVLVREGETQGCRHTQERPREDTMRRRLSVSQGQRRQGKPSLLDRDRGLPASRTVRNELLLLKPLSVGLYVTMAEPAGAGSAQGTAGMCAPR